MGKGGRERRGYTRTVGKMEGDVDVHARIWAGGPTHDGPDGEDGALPTGGWGTSSPNNDMATADGKRPIPQLAGRMAVERTTSSVTG